jgi:hypothetical protein
MPLVGFEPMISAGERPKTYALDCAATGTSIYGLYSFNYTKTMEHLTKIHTIVTHAFNYPV